MTFELNSGGFCPLCSPMCNGSGVSGDWKQEEDHPLSLIEIGVLFSWSGVRKGE